MLTFHPTMDSHSREVRRESLKQCGRGCQQHNPYP
jgi:hypothetical protein